MVFKTQNLILLIFHHAPFYSGLFAIIVSKKMGIEKRKEGGPTMVYGLGVYREQF